MGFVFKHKIIFLDLLLLFLYLDSFAQDWIITDNKVVEDSTILLDGNLIVKNGSSLTLNNVTLDVNCKFDGEYEIQVEPGGSMFIYNNSKISSIDLQYGFAFGVHGSAFEMKNSQLNGCGWGLEQELRDYESLISGRNGLYVNTDSAIIQGNTFSNNHVGIILADTTITLDKNNILSNTVHGIYIDNGVNCLLSDNYIEHGGNASAPIRMSPGFNNRITNNTIVSSIHRGIIEIFGSNNNIIENNNISGQGMGIMLAVSNNNIVRNNEISVDEAGIQIWGWDNRVEGNMISAAVERPSTGIYMVNAYNTIVSNNKFYDVRDENGIFLRHSSNNIIINNKVTASVSDERRPSTALLLWSKCKNNIIQNNEFSDFHRGMSLFYSCDSNIIAGNKISSIELQGFIVDGSDGNIFHSDNIFNDIGMSSFDNGENIWEYTGSVPELNPASPPKSSEIFGRTITGIEVIENQILDLGTLIIAEGAELTLRDVTLFTGRDSNKTSHIDIEPGGSLYIDNCKVIHDEYGNGFQFSPTSGSIFEMRNSELHFCGSEWWFGGLQNSSDKVVVEDNIITNTVILSSGGIWAGNTIKECYGAFLSSGSCRIINNKIHSCIRTAIISQGGEIKNNVIYDTWENGIHVWDNPNCSYVGNKITGIKPPNAALWLGEIGNIAKENIITDCYIGLIMENGHTALNNEISLCEIGIETHSSNNRLEGNALFCCKKGITLFPSNNKVFKNTIANCDTGLIASFGIPPDMIYNNNFIVNTIQAKEHEANIWDSSGIGNFWSDYTGVDLDNNGIGDTPYFFPNDGIDHYPLMKPIQSNFTPSTIEEIICKGDSILLDGIYQTDAGFYYNTLQTINGCDSIIITNISFYPTQQPTIIVEGNRLYSTGSYQTYQWFDSNGEIIGATANEYTITESGEFYLTVTDDNGCTITSEVVNVIYTSINSTLLNDFKFSIIPNPNTGKFTFRIDSNISDELTLKLVNTTGQIIEERNIKSTLQNHTEQFDVGQISKGIYYLIIIVDKFQLSEKIIVQ